MWQHYKYLGSPPSSLVNAKEATGAKGAMCSTGTRGARGCRQVCYQSDGVLRERQVLGLQCNGRLYRSYRRYTGTIGGCYGSDWKKLQELRVELRATTGATAGTTGALLRALWELLATGATGGIRERLEATGATGPMVAARAMGDMSAVGLQGYRLQGQGLVLPAACYRGPTGLLWELRVLRCHWNRQEPHKGATR